MVPGSLRQVSGHNSFRRFSSILLKDVRSPDSGGIDNFTTDENGNLVPEYPNSWNAADTLCSADGQWCIVWDPNTQQIEPATPGNPATCDDNGHCTSTETVNVTDTMPQEPPPSMLQEACAGAGAALSYVGIASAPVTGSSTAILSITGEEILMDMGGLVVAPEVAVPLAIGGAVAFFACM